MSDVTAAGPARAAAASAGGLQFPSLGAIGIMLKRGDIVTPMYAPEPHSILDDSGRVLPEVVAARKRGVWFDVGNGRNGHIWWSVAERAVKQGFLPDTMSTDWTPEGRAGGVVDFPNCLSKLLLLGMPLDRVIARLPADGRRPLAADRSEFEHLYQQRAAAYSQAHRRLPVGRASVDALVEQVMDWLES